MRISYFVHDIGHPDLPRRLALLQEGGAQTTVFGFHRKGGADAANAVTAVDLGRTVDARLVHRIWAVARAALQLRRHADMIASGEVILARNLEMLLVAALARHLYAPRAALVYECLDIHRLMLSKGVPGAVLRRLERHLLARSQGLMVSSPGFVREYFQPTHQVLPKVFLVENKVVPTGAERQRGQRKSLSGPPWRIGWFGLLRCRRSLEILSNLVREVPDLAHVVVAGRPSPDIFPDIARDFEHVPGLDFHGPFKDEAELADLFGSVHFAWAIDFYSAAANSAWLLSNRLYRATLYGSVPLAMANVETGRWLADHGAGILLGEPLGESLEAMVRGMTADKLATARAALRRVPRSALVCEPGECRDLVRALGELGQGTISTPQEVVATG